MYLPLVAVAALLTFPAFAHGVDCNRSHDPVARTICSHPKVLALDSQLSSAYAAALARNPSRATALRQDEINWLGERNREVWWLLAGQREFPSLPSDIAARLTRVYRLRIAFLRSVDNPAATHDAPFARTFLESVAASPRSATDPLKAMQTAGVIVLAKEHGADDVERTIAALAAPPNPALRAALDRFRPSPYTVEYLPSVGLGGAFVVQGTADCQYWIMFQKQSDTTVPIGDGASLGGCMRDDGATGYLALINGHPIALTVTNDPSFWNVTDFQWRDWTGSHWGPERRVRFRYAYSVKPGRQMYCSSASQQCTSSMGIALNDPVPCPATLGPCATAKAIAIKVAKQYLRNAVALAYHSDGSEADRTGFKYILRLAPDHKGWANCMYPVWFPVHLDGELAVGGITQAHLACHPGGASLNVGFWVARSNESTWWFVDNTVDVDRDGLLSAAIVPVATNHR